MKILFTGGSSFTGSWFIRELARAGHDVTAIFRQPAHAYPDELRRERVAMALEHSRGVFGCNFGDDQFIGLLRSENFDLLCHHGADVTNYKSDDFDVAGAVAANTNNAARVFLTLADNAAGNAAVVLTGSVFENDEGAGSGGLEAFSPYGLSKAQSYQALRFCARRAGLAVGKFVIPNPFGPLEEPRFTAYLMKNWFAGNTAAVNTPAYVRDNIHVSLLSLAYRDFAEQVMEQQGLHKLNPSGYIETQGAFAERFAAAMRERLSMACELDLQTQTDFPEPRERYNTDPIDAGALGWDEAAAWDEIATYYDARLGNNELETTNE
ncbi:MAG: NAD(P)-dependent oxidoreductase [Gammaproteobacteria bacterium]|nr:NAD(P)-dependent oxidoreductase [Gammaproteobacteria bacterium]